MNEYVYTVIHIVGIMALFTALGAVAASESKSCNKLGAMLHGIALILILISGFGMVAVLKIGFTWWIIAKLIIWIIMGGMLAVAKRRLLPCGTIVGIILGLGALAAFLGVFGRMNWGS